MHTVVIIVLYEPQKIPRSSTMSKCHRLGVLLLAMLGPHYFEFQAYTSRCGIYSRPQRVGHSLRCHIVDRQPERPATAAHKSHCTMGCNMYTRKCCVCDISNVRRAHVEALQLVYLRHGEKHLNSTTTRLLGQVRGIVRQLQLTYEI